MELGSWTEEGKMVLSKLESLENKASSMESTLNDLKIELAVHNVKIGQSSAFFGAISGMIIAILTAIIINYATSIKESNSPKVIYKQDLPKLEVITDDN